MESNIWKEMLFKTAKCAGLGSGLVLFFSENYIQNNYFYLILERIKSGERKENMNSFLLSCIIVELLVLFNWCWLIILLSKHCPNVLRPTLKKKKFNNFTAPYTWSPHISTMLFGYEISILCIAHFLYNLLHFTTYDWMYRALHKCSPPLNISHNL